MNIDLTWITPIIKIVVFIVIVYYFVKVLWTGLKKLGRPSIPKLKLPFNVKKTKETLICMSITPDEFKIGDELEGYKVTKIVETEPKVLVNGNKSRTFEIWGEKI